MFQGVGPFKAEFDEFEAKYPAIVKTIEDKVLELRKAGIPEDPRLADVDKTSLKYELLTIVYEADYLKAKVKEAGLSTYTLTADDKAQIKAEMETEAVAKGVDPALVGKKIPDTVELF